VTEIYILKIWIVVHSVLVLLIAYGVVLIMWRVTRILLIVPLIMLFSNKGVKLFFYASLLLIPQAISDCGILHSKYAWFRSYESVYDWSITALIAVLYGCSLYHLIKSLINKQELS
jgi:hypothetical protein